MSNPIADLSYRNYDGPLDPPRLRWWGIAKTMIKIGFKKKSTWYFAIGSAWYYLAMTFILFLMDTLAAQTPEGQQNPIEQLIGRIVWKDQFLHGVGYGQILFMAVSLILGAGAIANDNRSNALLVYLSKPVSKKDYLLGKWVGVFLPLWLMMVLPALVFFLYGFMSYQDKGFISDDPWLFVKIMVIFPVLAAFHSSLIIGVSSLFNQGKIAGATYAGIYFISNFFTVIMSISHAAINSVSRQGREVNQGALAVVDQLFYCSIDGLCIGFTKALLGTNGSMPFLIPSQGNVPVPAPNFWMISSVMLVISAGMMLLAWSRIRAVEVVG